VTRRRSWFDALIDLLALAAAALLCALVVLVVLDVAARYLRLFSLPWAFDATEYMLYAMTFLGAPWVLREESHIAIELVVERLPAATRRAVRRIADLVGATVCLVIVIFACRVAWRSFQSGVLVQKTLVFPEWWVYAGIPPVMLILLGIFIRWIMHPPAERSGTREVA
jgi:TRAP-type C4-dicarboxylate transport system permease small subunit